MKIAIKLVVIIFWVNSNYRVTNKESLDRAVNCLISFLVLTINVIPNSLLLCAICLGTQ